MDKLAAEGLRYNRFHTTALCSPTRAALITGRNHHSASFAGITEAATGYDGYTCILPRSCGTVGEVLAPERLHDGVDRQEPQHAGVGNERGGSVRSLGQRAGLRLLLRLQRRRHESLESRSCIENQESGAGVARSGLSPDHRPRRQVDRLGAPGEEPSRPTSPISSMSRPARPTRRTTRRRSGSTSSRASSTAAGTPTGEQTLARQKKLGVVPQGHEADRRAPKACRRGTR